MHAKSHTVAQQDALSSMTARNTANAPFRDMALSYRVSLLKAYETTTHGTYRVSTVTKI